ncbi:MAG: hypothetical protein LRS43_02930, partial [Desulfurococcales archaeon]|nr:hypothetical protein [Desulfurococcales archaeon]
MRFSGLRQIDASDVEGLASLVLEIASSLRGRGYRVGTGEVVQAINMVRSYASIMGLTRISEKDLAMIITASMPSIADEKLVLQEIRALTSRRSLGELISRLEEQVEERLEILGARLGQGVSRKSIVRGAKGSKERRERLRAYLELKKAGLIVKRSFGEAVVDPITLKKRLARMASLGIRDLREALEKRGTWDRDSSLTFAETRLSLEPESLGEADMQSIINLAEAAIAKGNYRLLRESGRELLKRISQGYRADPERAKAILRKAGLLTPEAETALATIDYRVVEPRSLEPERVASLVSVADLESGAEIVARYLKEASPDDARRLLSMVDPALLWKVKKTSLKGRDAGLVE